LYNVYVIRRELIARLIPAPKLLALAFFVGDPLS
jgi:hypothetical protein